jgi:Cap4 SAVED domain
MTRMRNPNQRPTAPGLSFPRERCRQFADHLIEWLPEYALLEEELRVHHGNIFVKLQQAAVRVYTSDKHQNRGEIGEIALHAICRDFFGTIPISPRVFYKSSSNDVVKAFDMVHAYFPAGKGVELWLGESKLYGDADAAIRDAMCGAWPF